jgi:cell division septation protein DedD
MSRGLLTGRRSLSLILVLGVAALVLSGCGGGDQEEATTQQKPQTMVPGAETDSTAVDTAVVSDMEGAYEAGTLSGAEGDGEYPDSDTKAPAETAAEINATPAEAETPPGSSRTSSGTRQTTTASSGDGAYSLQLGSFTNLDNARKQADRISALGYAPVIEESNLGGQIYHRVMLLGVGDMAEASRLGELIHSELDIAYLVRRVK